MGTEAAVTYEVRIESSDRFVSKEDTGKGGRIASEHAHMIQGLLDESSLQLFATCAPDAVPTARKSNRIILQVPCTLDITVFGPPDLFEELGLWFQDYDVYLQDPVLCHLDVKYFNPHKLSTDDIGSCLLVSDVVRKTSRSLQLQILADRPDLLNILSSSSDLDETDQPSVIKAVLKK